MLVSLKARLDKALNESDDGQGVHKIRALTRLRNSGILMELGSDEAVRWFDDKVVRGRFLGNLHLGAFIKPRVFNVVVQFVPLTFRLEKDAELRELEQVNGLDDRAMMKARWIKPAARWSPSQTCSHMILSFSSPVPANDTLAYGLFICQKKVYMKKCKKEPLQCLKCHLWGHVAADCLAVHDTCGTCAHHHCTANCTNLDSPRCISCGVTGHASWARDCPVFQWKCQELGDRMKDNSLPYFLTLEAWTSWTQVKEPPRVIFAAQPPISQLHQVGLTAATDRPCCPGPTEVCPGLLICDRTRGQAPDTSLTTGMPPLMLILRMSSTLGLAPVRLNVWQKNLNKSRAVHEDLINSPVFKNFDVLVLQEPFMDSFGNTKATRHWRVVYPSSQLTNTLPTRSVMLVNANIDTNKWAQLSIQDTGDLVTIQFYSSYGKTTLFGIYNDCHHSTTVTALDDYSKANMASLHASDSNHVLWCGDFNRHHPLWDEERNSHLFTAGAIQEAEILLSVIADHDMVMALPKDIPTLQAMATKNWTRPDNVFCLANTESLLVSCTTDPQLRGLGTNHVPILTTLEFPVECIMAPPTYNFRLTDWGEFRVELTARLSDIAAPGPITTEAAFHNAVSELTGIVQDTIRTTVQISSPSPFSKRWWNKKLEKLKKEKNKLSSLSYRYRAVSGHCSHEEH